MKKISRLLALFLSALIFFLLVLAGLFSQNFMELTITDVAFVILKAMLGFVIFYFLGLIAADLVLKAVKNAVEDSEFDKMEGGLAAHFVDGRDKTPTGAKT